MKETKETVKPGKFVAYSYKLYNEADGELLFEAKPKSPDVMVFGISHEIVPGLAAALEGLGKDDKFEVVLPPAAAFGDRNPEYELSLDRDVFMRDGKLADEVKEGALLPMLTAEGYRVMGKILEIGDKIKMDFNHPFAGMTVKYQGKVEEVRDATPEELQPAQSCGNCHGGGCHGQGGDCGCGSEGDCAEGCGGGSCGSCCD